MRNFLQATLIKLILLTITPILFSAISNALPVGYVYKKDISIDYTKVSGTNNHIDFPLLLKIVDLDLRSVSNGGKVNSENGYDIVFTQENCMLDLDHQVEFYNPTTGELTVWVKIPILYITQNTNFSMYYGNATITSITSLSNTWNSNYESVLHLSDNPSNVLPQMVDGSGNNNAGICQGAMNTSNMITGIIAGGISFDEVNDRIVIPDFDYANTKSFSISFWFQQTDNFGTSYQYMFSHGAYGVFHSLNIYFGETTVGIVSDRDMLKSIFQDANDATNTLDLDAGNTHINNNWHYYVFTVNDLGNPTVYIDGVAVGNITFNGGQDYNPTTDIFLGARSDLNATRFYGGNLDEFRILNDSLSSSWIQTEYTNITDPANFYSIGMEQASYVGCAPLPIASLNFIAKLNNQSKVDLNVVVENDFSGKELFIEKSNNTIDWQNVANKTISNNIQQNWNMTDEKPFDGLTYFRVRKVKYDNTEEYSSVEAVYTRKLEIYNTYPMPVQQELTMEIISEFDDQIVLNIIDDSGKEVSKMELMLKNGLNKIAVSCQYLSTGIYQMRILSRDEITYDSVLLLKSEGQ